MTVKNYSKITSLVIFLIIPVHWKLFNIGFKRREAASFEVAFELLLLIVSKYRFLKRYLVDLSLDNKLTLNQSVQGLCNLIFLNTWSVVISYVKRSFILTLRKFLTFSAFHFGLRWLAWLKWNCFFNRLILL